MAVADVLRPVVESVVGGDVLPVSIRAWDGSRLGPDASPATIVIRSPMALRYLLYGRGELGLGRAYVAGEIDIEGDIYAVLALQDQIRRGGGQARVGLGWRGWFSAAAAARSLGAIGPPPPVPAEEARLSGRRHSPGRDAAAIAHHYDVSNDFYRLFLGETMTYSCGYFARPGWSLDEAQEAKYELVCKKLDLHPGDRLLDVGCGWGGMAIHAARHHGARALGVTLSRRQSELANALVVEAGMADQVEIRYLDYRCLAEERFDAISSIGMFEHVGLNRLANYFSSLYGLLRPRGRLLNHAISRPPGRSRFQPTSFIERYVFPDGELHEVGTVVSAMQSQGFEVRDVESLREHYALTLRHWVANLEDHFDEAVSIVGPGRARVWRLYMAASAVNFEAGRTSVHQVLGVRSDESGGSGMAATREAWSGWEQSFDTVARV
ncbi:MAG: class I SAM-dependent methyltransferase [Acidimicrobiales bacterium]